MSMPSGSVTMATRLERRCRRNSDAYQRHDQHLLQQFAAEVVDGAIDQAAAVVGGDDLHARRQAGLQLLQLCGDRGDGGARVLARAQDDHAADGLALAVQFADAAAHLGPELDVGDVAERDRRAVIEAQEQRAKILQRL